LSQSKGIVDEIVDLTGKSAELGVRIFGFTVTTSFRLLNATLRGIAKGLKPTKELRVKPQKREMEREGTKEVIKKPKKK
jgi:hypothetical protein